MNDADGNGFSSELKTALRILREEAPVREAWRSSSLERVRESARGSGEKVPPRIDTKRWSMRPALAIAAGVACAMAGAAATLAVVRSGEGQKALVASAAHAVPVTVSAGVLRLSGISMDGIRSRCRCADLPMVCAGRSTWFFRRGDTATRSSSMAASLRTHGLRGPQATTLEFRIPF